MYAKQTPLQAVVSGADRARSGNEVKKINHMGIAAEAKQGELDDDAGEGRW